MDDGDRQMTDITYVDAPSPWDDDLPVEDGVVAKVGFACPDGMSEWMWVHVTEIDPAGDMKGVLLNNPVDVPAVRLGDTVEGFRAEHIYEARLEPDAEKISEDARASRN